MKKRSGFTIVELVIVIAVIAVLAAVLIPIFGNITDKAEETTAVADSRSSYEEYLAKTLPSDIDEDLYVQVKNGYVRYSGGHAIKTGDKYVTNINEACEWIDRDGNYHSALYITIDQLAKLFLDDFNAYAEPNCSSIVDYYVHNMTASFWRQDEYYNKWSWLMDFFNYLAEKQNYTNLITHINKFLSEKGKSEEQGSGYGYVLQNVPIFFLKINAKIWDETYWDGVVNSKSDLASNWTTLDFTNVTFGDYAPFIPYDLFEEKRDNAKNSLLTRFAEEIVTDFNTYGEEATITTRENFKTTSHPHIKKVFARTDILEKYKWFFEFSKEEITLAAKANNNLEDTHYQNTLLMLQGMIDGDTNAVNINDEGNARTLWRFFIEGVINAKLPVAADIYEKCMIDYSDKENLRRFLEAYIRTLNIELPDTGGSNIPDGTLIVDGTTNNGHYASIKTALEKAEAGDTIYVSSGVYADELNITVPNLTILGPNKGTRGQDSRKDEAVIDGLTNINAANVTFDGVKFTKAIKVGDDNVTITNCYIIPTTTVNCAGSRDDASANFTNRKGCIVDIGETLNNAISNLVVSYCYIDVPGNTNSYTTQFMSLGNVNNLTLKGNFITNSKHTTASVSYAALGIYKCSGVLNFAENEFEWGTTGYLFYIGYQSNTCTEITIMDNVIDKNELITTTAGIRINKGSVNLVTTIQGNTINNCCGSMFLFNDDNGSNVKIQYNNFGLGTIFKIGAKGSANISFQNNYYAESIYENNTTVIPSDFDTYSHDASGLVLYEEAYATYKA